MSKNKVLQLKVDLKTTTFRMFEEIKNYYGLKSNAEVVRLMIHSEYRQIERERERVPIPKKEPD